MVVCVYSMINYNQSSNNADSTAEQYQEKPMRTIILISSLVLLCACTAEPGSEKWWEEKSEQPKSEWSTNDAMTYTKNCLVDGMAIGSDEW